MKLLLIALAKPLFGTSILGMGFVYQGKMEEVQVRADEVRVEQARVRDALEALEAKQEREQAPEQGDPPAEEAPAQNPPKK